MASLEEWQKIRLTAPLTSLSTAIARERDEEGNKTINQYLVVRDLGHGMFGKVKLVLNLETEQICAMKVYNTKQLTKSMGSIALFSKTDNPGHDLLTKICRTSLRVRHPNVLQTYEAIDAEPLGKMFFFVDYVPNGALRTMQPDGSITGDPIPVHSLRNYMKDVIAGLAYLHEEHNTIHRDIKPDNLLLTAWDTILIGDYGAMHVGTTLYDAAGTPAFQAPEVISNFIPEEGLAGPPVDVWALGVTAYTLLVGRLPWPDCELAEMESAILHGKINYPDMPQTVQDFLARCLDINPLTRITLAELKEHPFFSTEPSP
eukprot:NODE_2780_length_1093_cov_46.880952_g2650_i0.p1 GENE.NODE_2780_length_1093_cov_46.880952_g2650_i0~~NODE_2780_length_1093_cov_46.880952_g2650_i0.p1  ORF type:complete len:323 (-),score=90.11 NODE_2780_length_1093_cov_46.880952_g2650_i0:123-1070(-)